MTEYLRERIDGKQEYVHRLVWSSAHGEIPKGFVVHHKDEDIYNNDLDNLELMTVAEHVRLHKRQWDRLGENHHRSRISNADAIRIRLFYYSLAMTYGMLSDLFGISRGGIRNIILGINWQHLPVDEKVYAALQARQDTVESILGRKMG